MRSGIRAKCRYLGSCSIRSYALLWGVVAGLELREVLSWRVEGMGRAPVRVDDAEVTSNMISAGPADCKPY